MRTYLEINTRNLRSNIHNLKSLLKPETKFLAVVKSNAYGHGLVESAKAANEAGANWFGVVTLDEAMTLRQAGILKPILVLASVQTQDARQAANQDISVPVISLEQAHEIAETNFDKPLKVHLKINTGLNRLGLESEELIEAAKSLSTNTNIILEGVYSHLASAEENDLDYTNLQISKFKEALKLLSDAGFNQLIRHLAATAATMMAQETHFDMVRCGIGVYGLWPSAEIKDSFDRPDFFRPVLTYKTELVEIRKVEPGDKIGYGCVFTVKKPMTLGVLPIGYYEGIDRKLSDLGEVLVDGAFCPMIGRICMNMTIVDLTKIDSQVLKVGQEVIIIGKGDGGEITVDDIASKIDTVNYEIVSRIPAHIKRIYI